MIKKFINIYSDSETSNEVVRTKSDLFKKYSGIFDFGENDFVISDSKVMFELLALINIELFSILEIRVEPPIPEIQYVPLEEMYVTKNIFRSEIRLLQGNQTDNQILSLLNVRSLIENSIEEKSSLIGRFINTISECDLPS